MPLLDFPRRNDQSATLSDVNALASQLGADDYSVSVYIASVLAIAEIVAIGERRIPASDAAIERARVLLKTAYAFTV